MIWFYAHVVACLASLGMCGLDYALKAYLLMPVSLVFALACAVKALQNWDRVHR